MGCFVYYEFHIFTSEIKGREELPLKITTINIPDVYLDCIEVLVNMGFYPSRSEAVRVALKQFLTNEADVIDDLQKENFEKLKNIQMDMLQFHQ